MISNVHGGGAERVGQVLQVRHPNFTRAGQRHEARRRHICSRHYNWRPGSYKGAYTRVAYYKLKPDVPEHGIETLSKSFIVPLLEKLLADGSIIEYEIDTEATHTEAPGAFSIAVISTNAEGLDKLNAALRDAARTNPMNGPAFDSMVDSSAHRDHLASSTVTYKLLLRPFARAACGSSVFDASRRCAGLLPKLSCGSSS